MRAGAKQATFACMGRKHAMERKQKKAKKEPRAVGVSVESNGGAV